MADTVAVVHSSVSLIHFVLVAVGSCCECRCGQCCGGSAFVLSACSLTWSEDGCNLVCFLGASVNEVIMVVLREKHGKTENSEAGVCFWW